MNLDELVPVTLPVSTFKALPDAIRALVDNLSTVRTDGADVSFRMRRKSLIALHRALRTVGK